MNPKTSSFPHPMEVKIGACKVMLRPAVDGTGVDIVSIRRHYEY